MRELLSLSTLLMVINSFANIYTHFEHKNNLLYINWEDQKGFSLSANKKDKQLLKYYGTYPFNTIMDANPLCKEKLRSINDYIIPNPNTSSVKTITASQLGLIQFRERTQFLGDPYYLIDVADVHKKEDSNALYIIDYNKCNITPIIYKNVEFHSPTTYNQGHLYYGIAKKENKYWIYEICAKTKKLNWYPLGITELKWKDNLSVLSNSKLAGGGKINDNNVLFTFDLSSKKLQILNLEQRVLEDLYLPYTQFERKYVKDYSYLLHASPLKTCNTELGFVKLKYKDESLTFSWDIVKNKLSEHPIKVPPDLYSNSIQPDIENKSSTSSSIKNESKSILYSAYLKDNHLIASQMNLKTGISKELSIINIKEGNIHHLCYDTASEKMIINVEENKEINSYFVDFDQNIFKPIRFPFKLSTDHKFCQVIWKQDRAFLFLHHKYLLDIPYSTLLANEYLLSKNIYSIQKDHLEDQTIIVLDSSERCYWLKPSTHQIKKSSLEGVTSIYTKNQYSFRFLKSNRGDIIEKFDTQKGEAFILKVPKLNNQATNLWYTHPNRWDNFYKYGSHFIGFDTQHEKIIEYKIPNKKFDAQWTVGPYKFSTKQINNNLWMWVADTKKQIVTALKFPNKLPKGCFNLKNYIVKQTKAITIPNQKWHQVDLKNINLN